MSKDSKTCPENNEDWKYVLHLFDGPKPSHVEKVEMELTTDGRMALMWITRDTRQLWDTTKQELPSTG